MTELEEENGVPATAVAPASPWDALRKQEAEVGNEEDPLYLADPMRAGVVFRYKYVPLGATKGATERLSKIVNKTDLALSSAISSLLLSLDEILVEAPDGVVPLAKDGTTKLWDYPVKPLADPGEAPMRFDERVVKAMGYPSQDCKRSYDVLRHWYRFNDFQILEQSRQVGEWNANVGTVVRDELEATLPKA